MIKQLIMKKKNNRKIVLNKANKYYKNNQERLRE